MRILETTRELQSWADAERASGRRIALVPTMGALHTGHLSLIEEARRKADCVVVSIFVNPTQFCESEDFDRYPRQLEDDLARCREAGVDVVWAPSAEDLYPPENQTWVEVTGLSQPLCGASRPGHFRGVTTIVTKLFLAAKPHVAVFGEKDYQQLAVIRRMTRDLGFDVEILGVPTLRESDGLAMSSRNARLGPQARAEAVALGRALDAVERAVAEGERSVERLGERLRRELAAATLGTLDYAEFRDAESLELAPAELSGDTVLALAVEFDPGPGGQGSRVRLIDNRVLSPRS